MFIVKLFRHHHECLILIIPQMKSYVYLQILRPVCSQGFVFSQQKLSITFYVEIVDATCKPLFKLEAMLNRLYCHDTGSVRYTLLYFRDNTKNRKTFGAKYEKKCALFS